MWTILRMGVLVVALVYAAPVLAEKPGPMKGFPELEVLNQYVGTWDVTVRAGTVDILVGEAKSEWILDGRYLQQMASLQPQDGSTAYNFKTLMTYDNERKKYRSWTFVNNGSTSEAEGVWDAKAKVLKWTSRKDEKSNLVTTTADFSQPGIEKVKIVTTNPKGAVASEMSAENKLRK